MEIDEIVNKAVFGENVPEGDLLEKLKKKLKQEFKGDEKAWGSRIIDNWDGFKDLTSFLLLRIISCVEGRCLLCCEKIQQSLERCSEEPEKGEEILCNHFIVEKMIERIESNYRNELEKQ